MYRVGYEEESFYGFIFQILFLAALHGLWDLSCPTKA